MKPHFKHRSNVHSFRIGSRKPQDAASTRQNQKNPVGYAPRNAMKLNARLFFLVILFPSPFAAADTITMKNGNSLDGIIQKETPTQITLGVGVGVVTINKSQIATIKKSDAQGESQIQDAWQQHYFAHDQYVPKGLESVAAEFRSIDAQRRAAMEDLAYLRSPAAGHKALQDELQRLQQESTDCMRRLPPTPPPADAKYAADIENYNALIGRHNALQARMEIVNDTLLKKNVMDDHCRRRIAAYLQALLNFQTVFAARYDQHRKTGGTKQEDVFFTEMAKRIGAYSTEIREIDVPFETDGLHAVVTARINNQTDARLLLDTGATLVQISETLAKRLNLRLPDEPKLKVTLADGSEVRVKPVVLDSVQVADARAEHVRGIVSPSEPSPGVDGLLGMSFLQEFDMRLDGANHKLILKRFDPKP
jgi:clan AA aspartic protease (TIGR02281 family)